MEADDKISYRDKLVALCKKNNWYMVNWHGHFIHQFLIVKRDGTRLANDIYAAIMESKCDLVRDDEEVYRINVGDCTCWKDFYYKLLKEIRQEEMCEDEKDS